MLGAILHGFHVWLGKKQHQHIARNYLFFQLFFEGSLPKYLSQSVWCLPRIGSNGVTITKFLQLFMISELYLELSYFLNQIYIVATGNCNWSNLSSQVPHLKVTLIVTKILFKINFPIPDVRTVRGSGDWLHRVIALAADATAVADDLNERVHCNRTGTGVGVRAWR